MLDILKDYLNTTANHVVADAVKESFRLFDQINLTDYEYRYEEILMMDDIGDTNTVYYQIIDLTKSLQTQILLEHGIVLIEDANLETINLFVKGILEIQDYEDKQQLLSLLHSCSNTNEVLCECIALVTHRSTDELMIDVVSVQTSLIDRMIDNLSNHPGKGTSTEEIEENQKYLSDLETCSAKVGDMFSVVREMLEQGVPPGLPFTMYCNILQKKLVDLDDEKAAANLLGMAVISVDGSINPRKIINDDIGIIYENAEQITKINVFVGKFLVEYGRI